MNNKKHLIAASLAAVVMASATAAPKNKESAQSLYDRGMTVYKIDPEASLGLLNKAARLGHVDSMVRLGYCYQTGTGTTPSPKTALGWYTKAVDAGNTAPLYEIGVLHETGGSKVPPDLVQAIEWYEKGVTNNSIKACAALARIYASSPDPDFHDGPKAIRYATVLVQKSPRDPVAFDLLAAAYARNLQFVPALKAASEAVALSPLEEAAQRRERKKEYEAGKPYPETASDEWILQAAEQENIWAMLRLADEQNDILGPSYDPASARRWYEAAAEDGSKDAMVKLGAMCLNGRGGPAHTKKAFWCFNEAAKAGIPEAYAPLARMYVGGKGTHVDLELAKEGYEKAAKAGIRQAAGEQASLRVLGRRSADLSPEELYKEGKQIAESNAPGPDGTVMPLNKKTQLVYPRYWLAAEQGHAGAMKELAEMYFYGKRYFVRDADSEDRKTGGITSDYIRAWDWYEQLSRKGIDLPEKARCKALYLEELKARRIRWQKKERDSAIAKSKQADRRR
ncbi:tetratricopeptide repeat protein [Pontiella sulfatireligans]|uniref:Secretory immunoglobulin A-binding protein EsiB n=1 Tax=Pontiella sulfatireligans TaxID=2750658 RepID=A0A6C2UP92_9BACT|nr:tetratricopeptide repeat protein [Pontiella sulfatireligans]VGO22018.1 Secretory immunoglobulin A-binding protein EsiB [Pontiella sulfatireligans]